jgi:putative membrane protein
MIQDHSKTSDALRNAAEASGMPAPPPSMSSDQSMMLYSLQSLRGDAFDRAYVKQQILAHQQALAVTQSYASSGPDKNLRGAAAEALPIIRRHLDMAEKMHADFAGS